MRSVLSASIGAIFSLFLPHSVMGDIPESATELRFSGGNCDGSAAVMIDNQTLLVANDETNELHSFDIAGGKRLASARLVPPLKLPKKAKKEIDIEGVARDNDVLWWIGSHGLDGGGKTEKNRRTLFATNIPGRDLLDLVIVHQRANLTRVFKASTELTGLFHAAVWDTPPKEGGFNIEGLAKAGENELLVALRSPLTGTGGIVGDAIAFSITFDQGVWTVGDVHTLPLKDRGIRDIVPTVGGYFLIAGGVGSDPDQTLYFWNGLDDPLELSVPGIADLNAEGLVQVGMDWLVLGDRGSVEVEDMYQDNEKCKDIANDNPADPAVYFDGILYQMSR